MFAETSKRKQEAIYGTITCLTLIITIGYMTQSVIIICLLSFMMTTPVWLPYVIIRIRFKLFNEISGEEGLQIPSEKYDDNIFRYLYTHPSANLRTRTQHVSIIDFLFYIMEPGNPIHMERLEDDSREYKILSQVTKSIISKPHTELSLLFKKYILSIFNNISQPTIVHIRHFVFNGFIQLFHELVFNKPLTNPDEIKLFYDHGNDIITCLKFLKLRNLKARTKLFNYLYNKILIEKKTNKYFNKHFECDINDEISDYDRALFLQGVVWATGVVQISEAFAHFTIALAQNRYDNTYNFDNFISEVFRLYPLFGVTVRITSNDIKLPNNNDIIPSGTVLTFNHPEFHRIKYKNASTFDYKRWNYIDKNKANFIPFGFQGARPCPAKHMSMVWLKTFASDMINKYEFYSPILHTRSLPHGGLCLIVPKGFTNKNKFYYYYCKCIMTTMWVYQQFRNVISPFIQLFCGGYILWDAKRKHLAKTWLENN
eukprot:548591_1